MTTSLKLVSCLPRHSSRTSIETGCVVRCILFIVELVGFSFSGCLEVVVGGCCKTISPNSFKAFTFFGFLPLRFKGGFVHVSAFPILTQREQGRIRSEHFL